MNDRLQAGYCRTCNTLHFSFSYRFHKKRASVAASVAKCVCRLSFHGFEGRRTQFSALKANLQRGCSGPIFFIRPGPLIFPRAAGLTQPTRCLSPLAAYLPVFASRPPSLGSIHSEFNCPRATLSSQMSVKWGPTHQNNRAILCGRTFSRSVHALELLVNSPHIVQLVVDPQDIGYSRPRPPPNTAAFSQL